MRICLDLDHTLCTGKPYEESQPLPGAVELLKKLKADGHIIILSTARGMGSSAGNIGSAIAKIGLLTLSQLNDWGFVYDEIWFGKPSFDIAFDDKCFNVSNIDDITSILLQKGIG